MSREEDKKLKEQKSRTKRKITGSTEKKERNFLLDYTTPVGSIPIQKTSYPKDNI